jgi:hypothetical protein
MEDVAWWIYSCFLFALPPCVCVCVCMHVCLFMLMCTFFLSSELRVSCLLGRQSTGWTISTALFALVILKTKSHILPRLASNMSLLF